MKLAIGPILFLLAGGALADPPANHYDRSNAGGNQVILRAAPADVQPIADQYGLSLVGAAGVGGDHMAVVQGPELMTSEQIEALLAGDSRIESHEAIALAALPGLETDSGATPDTSTVAADLERSGSFQTPCWSGWSGYADQAAANLIQVTGAHAHGCGGATVAVLDTGVDPDHPALAGALLSGYDFLTEQTGLPSEWDFLGGSLQPILDGSLQPILDGSLQPILDQSVDIVVLGQGELAILDASIAPFVDPDVVAALQGLELPPFFGHGTMVAGLVRLAAPGAAIMPLRVFDGSGSAHLFDIIRAIYYAVDHGADVINMSFSMPGHSPELRRAVQYARSHGVVCVAAAGNGGESTQVYPAALAASVGVAATDLDDQLSPFSNYGSALVDLAAPGSGVVSTYPGGVFGAGWGTSFSTPLVAGTLALIHHLHGGDAAAFQGAVHDLSQGSVMLQDLAGDVGSGRLDVLGTVLQAQ